eukprot:scaffold294980_cov21-Tisochrysis_lutea.AAC.2
MDHRIKPGGLQCLEVKAAGHTFRHICTLPMLLFCSSPITSRHGLAPLCVTLHCAKFPHQPLALHEATSPSDHALSDSTEI